MLSKFVFKLPYVIFGHGSEFNQKNIFSKKFISVTYSNADLVIFNSFYTKGLAEDIGIRNRRNIVIPLGGDDEVFDIRKYDKDNLKIKFNLDRKIIILSVGSLRLLKGHKIVINAIDILRREIPSIIYFIIGEGPEQKKLWELVQKLKLEKYIKIVGALTWAELVKYYAMCDIFILNSVYEKNNRQESFGIVFIEAALMGKPVIGTRTGGIAEVIEHEKTGILIQPNSVYETVDGLKKLISNVKFANKLGENGYIKAKKNYTWRNVALQTNFYLKKYFEN